MKKTLSVIAFLVISITSLTAADTKYFSKIVYETDAPLRLEIRANLYMRITDIHQSGVQNVIGGAIVYKDAAREGVFVMSANGEKEVVVAGPVVVVVNPVPGATLFINYLLGRN